MNNFTQRLNFWKSDQKKFFVTMSLSPSLSWYVDISTLKLGFTYIDIAVWYKCLIVFVSHCHL